MAGQLNWLEQSVHTRQVVSSILTPATKFLERNKGVITMNMRDEGYDNPFDYMIDKCWTPNKLIEALVENAQKEGQTEQEDEAF